jgi:hypothetical protein
MFTVWNKDQEKDFFIKSLVFANPEQLCCITKNKKYLAYWPQIYDGAKNITKQEFLNRFLHGILGYRFV